MVYNPFSGSQMGEVFENVKIVLTTGQTDVFDRRTTDNA